MNWNETIKQRVGNDKYPTLGRIKVGRAISAWAVMPFNMSFWMLPIGVFMQMNQSPKMWAKDKIRYFNEWRAMRW